MEQNAKKTGLLNWVAMLGAALALLALTNYAHSAACVMAAALATFGLLVGLMSYFQMGMVERERFEQLEMEELSKSRGGQSLFTSAGEDTFPARRSRQQFEKIVAPCFTGLLLVLQIGAAYLPWTRLTMMPPFIRERATLAMALL